MSQPMLLIGIDMAWDSNFVCMAHSNGWQPPVHPMPWVGTLSAGRSPSTAWQVLSRLHEQICLDAERTHTTWARDSHKQRHCEVLWTPKDHRTALFRCPARVMSKCVSILWHKIRSGFKAMFPEMSTANAALPSNNACVHIRILAMSTTSAASCSLYLVLAR